jgi:hypothetical protein
MILGGGGQTLNKSQAKQIATSKGVLNSQGYLKQNISSPPANVGPASGPGVASSNPNAGNGGIPTPSPGVSSTGGAKPATSSPPFLLIGLVVVAVIAVIVVVMKK